MYCKEWINWLLKLVYLAESLLCTVGFRFFESPMRVYVFNLNRSSAFTHSCFYSMGIWKPRHSSEAVGAILRLLVDLFILVKYPM